MIEATIGMWLKSEGDEITAGEPMVELITDKAAFALPLILFPRVSVGNRPER